MIVTCASDMHGHFPKINATGDILIIAGDCTADDSVSEWIQFFDWLKTVDYRRKIIVAGNHDGFTKQWATSGTFTDEEYASLFDSEKPEFDYLCDSGIETEGIKIWGCPWTPWVKNMNPKYANYTAEDKDLLTKWYTIPRDTDILITHTPPKLILDEVKLYCYTKEQSIGSETLLFAYMQGWIKPQVHVFGHAHEGYGEKFCSFNNNYTHFINAAIMDKDYAPTNKPITFRI